MSHAKTQYIFSNQNHQLKLRYKVQRTCDDPIMLAKNLCQHAWNGYFQTF